MTIDSEELYSRARDVQWLVLDVDGTLTDGGLYYGDQGEVFKKFDVRDGLGLNLARLAGLKAAVLTGRNSRIVEIRAQELGLFPIYQGWQNKEEGLRALLQEIGAQVAHIAYIGDDVNDLAPMLKARFRACPQNAAREIRQAAHYVAQSSGGKGAIREIIEFILQAQGLWESVVARYTSFSEKVG